MTDNLQDEIQTQIFQSFTNNNNDNSDHFNSSYKNDNNIEFTFKKNITESNKTKETEKEISHNIYSKNDENIKQSGHFFNEVDNESKYKKMIDNEKEKYNNIIKPLFKLLIKKKKELKKLKICKINNKIFTQNLEKANNNKIKCFKKNLKLNNIGSNSNSGSNITAHNNYTLFAVSTKSPINSFLEISHESYTEANENRNTNENKENYNNQNLNKYINNINKKTINSITLNKSIAKRSTNYEKTRNKQKNNKNRKYIKYENNASFEMIKNEYRELKQKIIENKKKIKKKENKNNKECMKNKLEGGGDNNINSYKNLINSLKTNKTKAILNSINLIKKNIKQNKAKNLKINTFSPTSSNTQRLIENNHINSHRRLKTISPIFL